MKGGRGATKWWAEATSSLKTAKWHRLVPFSSLHVHKAAKSVVELISQSCGESQQAVSLSREDGAI